jgi:putative membrane protein
MTATQGDLASLSRFIFRTPRWYASLGFALVLAALTGVAVFHSSYPLADAYEGIFFVGVPTIVAALGTTAVDRALGGQMTSSRSSLLALTGEVLIVAILAVAGTVALFTMLGQDFVLDALILALASVFAFRLLILVAVSRESLLIAAIPASLQTVTGAVLLFVYSGTLRYLELSAGRGPLASAFLSRPEEAPPELLIVVPGDFLQLLVLCVLYGGGVWLFLAVIDRPWRRSLGVSVLDFIRGFVGHVAEDSSDLENFFSSIGEEAVVPVTVLSLRRPDGEEKARFVLPMIHPGPMGTIGGGNLPVRIAETADGLGFPPHATAGHDFNLVSENEVDRLIEASETAHDHIDYTPTATSSLQVHSGEVTATGQTIGDDLLLTVTFAPGCADDVDYAVGLSTIAEAKAGGAVDDVLLIDAHNCNDGLDGEDLGHVVPGSERSFDMMTAAREVADRLGVREQSPLSLGTAWTETPWEPTEGIGPLGIRVAVTEVEGDRTAYVLIDGNNMEPGLRATILDRLDQVDRAEVVTSDTHVVNTVDAVNQVGEAIPHVDLVGTIGDLVDEAIRDLEPVEAGMATERTTVTVFGNDRTETLASHANALVSMGWAVAGAITFALFAISLFVFYLY